MPLCLALLGSLVWHPLLHGPALLAWYAKVSTRLWNCCPMVSSTFAVLLACLRVSSALSTRSFFGAFGFSSVLSSGGPSTGLCLCSGLPLEVGGVPFLHVLGQVGLQ